MAVLCFAVRCFVSIILMWKRELVELFVFLVSRGCSVALSHDAMGVIVAFPDHTHLLLSAGA